MTIVGTRPELIKMSRVIAEFDRHTDHVLVHTGQNYDYELNQVFFDDLEIRKPDHFLDIGGGTAAEAIGNVIVRADVVMQQVRPDAVLLYGDTNSCLAVISAKRRKIPVFHMEAGNRCFDERVPEEINRRVLDHLSDINLVLSEHGRRNLLAEGLRPETIFKTGSHMFEVLEYYRVKIERSSILSRLGLEPRKYFVVSAHREENVDAEASLRALVDSIRGLVDQYGLPVVVSTHPRTKARLAQLGGMEVDSRIRYMKPFGFTDYIRLQSDSTCVLSDSGTITEEAALLGFDAVNIRNAHERPEGVDSGVLMMSGLRRDRVLDTVRIALEQRERLGRKPTVPDYINESVSTQILRIVESYTDYVRRTVWRET